MPGYALGGAAGGAEALEEVLRRKFGEIVARQRLAQDQQRLAEEVRQANMQHDVQRGQLGLGQQRLDQDASQFAAQEPTRLAQRAHLGAETESLTRAPLEAQKGRDFTAGQGQLQRDFAAGQGTLSRENAQAIAKINGQNTLAAARVRAANEPVVRVQTVDADGNPVTKVLPRSQAAGQDFAAAPTTDQRNRQAASGRAGGVLGAISELSEKINTGQGALAKIQGGVARAQAQANLNDDVSEYEAVVSGFTPLLARAVGHTGVLTEQDVQSVRKMLPQPGDSKSVRDRKMTRITGLMGGMSGQHEQAAGGDTVALRKKYNY